MESTAADSIAQAWGFYNSMPPHLPRPIDILAPQQAAEKVEPVRRKLFESYGRLRDIVLAHEETIQKRWKKRTVGKRKELLASIDSALPKAHAPEIAAFEHQYRNPQEDNSHKKDLLLPYLNLDDLSCNNGTQFLGLLHARAHRSPSEFAMFDGDMLHFGIVAKGIRRYQAVECSMIAFGDEDTYGKVIEYSESMDPSDADSPDGFQMEQLLHESLSFGDGLVVLESQSQLIDFLLDVVSKILVDLDLKNLTPLPPMPAPVIPITNTEFQWKSSSRANVLRPYGDPPVFSIDELANIIESQYELAVEHLVNLRTDPTYLSEELQSYYDHRVEARLKGAPQLSVQNRAMSVLLLDAYTFFVYYHVAKELVEEFRVVQREYPDGLPRARDLPKEYENALMSFYPLLKLLELRITRIHNTTIYASEAMRGGFNVRTTDPRFEKLEMTLRGQPNDRLYTYISLLLQQEQTHLWQLGRIFDQIDRITEDAAQNKRISKLLATLLSQWGAINDCKTILACHRPAVEDTEGGDSVDIKERLSKWESLLIPIAGDAKVGPDTSSLASKAYPASQFMYPKGPRDAEWARKCQAVDDNFAEFWKAADQSLIKFCGPTLFALAESVVEPHVMEPIHWASLVKKLVPKKRQAPAPGSVLPFGGASQTPVVAESSPTPKTKTKTRGVADPSKQEEAEVPAAGTESPVAKPAPIPVCSKAHKVLSTLFTATLPEQIASQQASCSWRDILWAFTSGLNFGAFKGHGSAWTLSHPDGHHSITIHEPHPDSTMYFFQLRRFGWRLAHRFGWSLDSFELEQKA
ncbi:hypothetical protein FB45DRAFT_1001296 [Roridomyces roridus]|uniref:Uncharacterized protein n=1 Tax=Roridomyces roridus TaxID=1738132 RepID=A0AAD7C5Z3_9AGAR|nr:hypothetical protein FB45DRAFT_1001296 [Roridomyces roridus]